MPPLNSTRKNIVIPHASTNWEDDYRALSQACGLIVLSDWSSLEITGSDRVAFLHNMCTNDIRRLSEGDTSEAFLTDVKGKIQAHVFVCVEAERITLLTVPGIAERIISQLDRYIIREEVSLTDATREHTWILVVGPQSQVALNEICERDSALPTEKFRFSSLNLAGQQCLVARMALLWPSNFLVRCENLEKFSQSMAAPWIDTSSQAWTSLRVESQLPLFGTDFDDSNLPQEVNRDAQAISFTKGCYLGQETIARIDALGHVNKKLVTVSFESESLPTPGTKLLRGGDEIGTVTTACWSPQTSRPAALAWVKRGANDLGCELESPGGKAIVVAAIRNEN